MNNIIKEDYVSYEVAKLLKEKGFEIACSHYYICDFQNFKHDFILYKTSLPDDINNDNIFQFVKRTKQPHLVNVPTIHLANKWIHENFGIWINVNIENNEEDIISFYFSLFSTIDGEVKFEMKKSNFNSPQEAHLSAIEYILKK